MTIFGKLFNSKQNESGSNPPDDQGRIRLAVCAVLIEIASSDDEFSSEETALIMATLRSEFGLTDEAAENLMSSAGHKINNSVDTWSLTNILNQNLSEGDRIRAMESIWKVIYADGKLSHHEDALAHKLSFLLGLTHEQMIAAKLKTKNRIAPNS